METLIQNTVALTLYATNLSDKKKEVKFLSEYSLKDKEIKYYGNGTEEGYFKIMKQLSQNPMMMSRIRIMTDTVNLYRPNLFKYNTNYFSKNGLMDESIMFLPLSFIDVKQYQVTVVDVDCSAKLHYSEDLSYVIEPNTSVSVVVYVEPFNESKHKKLSELKNNLSALGHPVWITNKADEKRTFKLFTNKEEYDNWEFNNDCFDLYYWGQRTDAKGLIDFLFDSKIKSFNISRFFSQDTNQLLNHINCDLGDGKRISFVPKEYFQVNQFMNNIFDIEMKSEIQNQYGKESQTPSCISMDIEPKATVCLWIKNSDKE